MSRGGAADIIKRAMRRLPGALAREALKTRVLLQVHDELVLETPTAEIDAASARIRRVMESAATLLVPLVVETGTGPTWADTH